MLINNSSEGLSIDITYLRPGNILIYPLYSETGEKILNSRTVLTGEKINAIIEKYGKYVYYTLSEEMSCIPNHRINSAYHKSIEIMNEVSRTEKLSKTTFKESEKLVEEILTDLHSSKIETIRLLKDLKSFDHYTFNHSVNVSLLVAVFAIKLGLFTLEEIKALILGAYLHDIGKMGVDIQLLNKRGKLNISEFQKIKRHPQLGYEIIKNIPEANTIVKQSILFHHERYNNKGYYNLPYANLPIFPKIISICDIFDAVTSKRPYKEAISPTDALKIIVNATNTHLDYNLISSFINKMGPILNNTKYFYSRHEICELNTQELALIIDHGVMNVLKPKVIIFCRFEKINNKIIAKFYKKPFEVDLQDDSSRIMKKILSNKNQINAIKDKLIARSLLQQS